ncbi:MAG: histidinol-phosphate transaminase [Eubacterium sp.]
MNKHGGYRGNNKKMLDFSININALGMPPELREKLIDAFDDLGKYPEITGDSARKKIATDIGMPEENVILGNGAIELIYLFARSIKLKSALIPVPTFNEYKRALVMNGWQNVHEMVIGFENGFTLDAEVLKKEIERCKPQVIFICNPTNPTGKLYKKKFLTELMDTCDPKIIWFIDESFIEFSGIETCMNLVRESEHHLFLLRSMTKFFGLPGLRIGYGIGSKSIVEAMNSHKEPWTINTLALTAAANVYDYKDYIDQTKHMVNSERIRVFEALSNIRELEVLPSGADFHLYRVKKGTAKDLQKKLNTYNINVRTCEDFAGLETHYFRAAIKKPEDNDRLISALKEIFKK